MLRTFIACPNLMYANLKYLIIKLFCDFLREYPCDHYTAIINVTLMNTGCPRTLIHETALQLLQILDKRFFGSKPFGGRFVKPDVFNYDVLLHERAPINGPYWINQECLSGI